MQISLSLLDLTRGHGCGLMEWVSALPPVFFLYFGYTFHHLLWRLPKTTGGNFYLKTRKKVSVVISTFQSLMYPISNSLSPAFTDSSNKNNQIKHRPKFVCQIKTAHIGFLWPALTDRLIHWLIRPNVINWPYHAVLSRSWSIEITSSLVLQLCRTLIAVMDVKTRHPLLLQDPSEKPSELSEQTSKLGECQYNRRDFFWGLFN